MKKGFTFQKGKSKWEKGKSLKWKDLNLYLTLTFSHTHIFMRWFSNYIFLTLRFKQKKEEVCGANVSWMWMCSRHDKIERGSFLTFLLKSTFFPFHVGLLTKLSYQILAYWRSLIKRRKRKVYQDREAFEFIYVVSFAVKWAFSCAKLH